MKEDCWNFGEAGRLVGIFTEPLSRSPRTALVLISAGLAPKAGPFRIYADLARRLARQEVATLRFDLGGIGDSRIARPDLPVTERTALEIRAALDELTSRVATERLFLGGLCSGAEDAFRYAEADPRVSGVVLVDPFSYPTPGFHRRDKARQIAKASLTRLGLIQARDPTAPAGSVVEYNYMKHEDSSRILKALIRRKAAVHFVYTGAVRGSFNHAAQLREMFAGIDFEGQVSLDYLPRLGHTQLLEEDRKVLVEVISRWFSKRQETAPMR